MSLLCAPAQAQDAAPAPAAATATAADKPAWQSKHALDAAETRWVPGKGLELNSKNKLFRFYLRPRGQLFYHVDIERVRDIGPVESDDQHAVGLIERQVLCFR